MSKILILSPAHPLRGGIASFSERLAKEFQDEGDEVVIYSFSLQYPNFLFPGTTQYSSDPAPKGIQIETCVNSINPLNWIQVGRRIRKWKPDLIVVRFWLPFMGPSLGTILRLAKRNTSCKVVAITDNVIPHEKRPGDRIFTQYFLQAVDACVVMSRSVEEDIRQFTATKPVAFSPHPIYDNYGTSVSRTEGLAFLDLPAQVPYILFFGFIRRYKGLDLLLQAMATPAVKELGIQLIIAGEYYDQAEFYENLIAEHHLAPQLIRRTHFISNEEVKYYFAAASLVVQPYRSATQSGISQIAYHFEKPMLVTRVGGLPEIVAHGKEGYVVDVDPEAIAEALVDFFSANREQEFEGHLKAAKSRFSWNHMTQTIKRLAAINT
ncbi:MAG: glycosyltransferase [Saprospiraceae bacterium]|nr:glycosyltransferase [Saprospiraceae bacterium]